MTTLVMAANKIGLHSLAARIEAVREKYARYRAFRKTVRELERLTDHELRDIGIHRGMIYSIAMEVYYDRRGWV